MTTYGATGRAGELAPGTAPIVAGLMLSMFLVALDATIVSTAMPSIVGNLGGFTLYAWVPAVYLLTTAVSTPIYGKLSDLFGRKPVLFFGIGLFLLGSVTSGAAPTMLLLIVFRALQGLGAGAVQPITITIIGDIFTLEQRARVQGFFSSVWGVSSLIGPLLGGTVATTTCLPSRTYTSGSGGSSTSAGLIFCRAARKTVSMVMAMRLSGTPTILCSASSTPMITTPPWAFAIPHNRSAISTGLGEAIFNSTVVVSPPLISRRSADSLSVAIALSF